MTEIEQLLEQANALRGLPDEEAEAKGLPKLVDRINAMRALGEEVREAIDAATEEGHEAEFAAVAESVAPKRGPGRPRKVAA